MKTEASERTITPAPTGTQLVVVGPDGALGNFSTVIAFVLDRDDQIIDVVTNTGDKLRTPHGQTGALVIGDRASFEGREYAWWEFVGAMRMREQKAASPPQRPAQRTQ